MPVLCPCCEARGMRETDLWCARCQAAAKLHPDMPLQDFVELRRKEEAESNG